MARGGFLRGLQMDVTESGKCRDTASEWEEEGCRVCGESSKVCRSGFSAFVANPQRNFPIFVAGEQHSVAGKLWPRKTQPSQTHSLTHRHTHSRPRCRIFRCFSFTIYFLSFFFALGEKIRFSYAAEWQPHRENLSPGSCRLTSICVSFSLAALCQVAGQLFRFSAVTPRHSFYLTPGTDIGHQAPVTGHQALGHWQLKCNGWPLAHKAIGGVLRAGKKPSGQVATKFGGP